MKPLSLNDFLKQSGGGISDIRPITSSSTVQPQAQTSSQGYFGDALSDIKQTGTNLKKTAVNTFNKQKEALGASIEGKQSLGAGLGQAFGAGAGGLSQAAGDVFMGGAKAILPQGGEDMIKGGIQSVAKPVMESDFAKNIMAKYESLDDNQKRNVDAFLGVGSLAMDFLGVGLAKKPIVESGKLAVKAGTELAKTAKPIARTTGRILKGAGEGAYGITVTPQESTKIAVQAYKAKQPSLSSRVKGFFTGEGVGAKPITEAETAARRGLVGTESELGVQAKKISGELWDNEISPKLDAIKGNVNMKSFIDEIAKEIEKTATGIRKESLREGLNAFRESYKNVSGISLRKLQDYKESWAEFLPDATYKGKPIANSIKEVHNLAAKKAREIIYKHVGEDGKQAYIDYGNLKSIAQSGIKNVGKDPVSRSISRGAWEFVMNQAITPIATIGGKILYKTGSGLEFIGKKGAKKVRDIVD